MITVSAGSPTVATMAAPPAAVPSVADPLLYIVTRAFVSRIDCKLVFAVVTFRVYLPVTRVGPEALTLVWEVSALGSSFIKLWADELATVTGKFNLKTQLIIKIVAGGRLAAKRTSFTHTITLDTEYLPRTCVISTRFTLAHLIIGDIGGL